MNARGGRRSFLSRYKRKRVVAALLGFFGLWLMIDLLSLPAGSEFRVKNPEQTALMRIRQDEASDLNRPLAIRQHWVGLSQISPLLIRAVLISEDADFYSHSGFDFREMWNSLYSALLHLSFPRGASTITQQLAKNLYFSESKNPVRKLREALMTLKLERSLSKTRILELYLNVIEMGDGVFGVEAASRHYFGMSAQYLSAEQAAFLAAMIPNPRSVYNPLLNPRRVEIKKRLLLRRMRANGN